MTEPFYMTITQGGAIPADEYSCAAWAKFKIGETLEFPHPKRKRNIKFHRMFFAALKFLFEQQDMYSVQDDLRSDIAIALGYFEIVTYRGKESRRAKSISFAKMDEYAFREFFDGFVLLASTRIAPNLETKHFDKFYEILDGNSGTQGQRITA